MSQNEMAEKLFGQKSMGAFEAAGQGIAIGVGAFMEGLGKVVDAAYSQDAQHFVGQGAQEIAAALFGNGTAFVMYPRAGKENEGQEQSQSQDQSQCQEMQPSQEMERGGRGR